MTPENNDIRAAIAEDQKQWFAANYDLGLALGYPKCCVTEFCQNSPLALQLLKNDPEFTAQARIRFEAGLVNGKFKGFIPCLAHAIDIKKGKTSIFNLIRNRRPEFGFFPKDNINIEAWIKNKDK